MPGPGPPRVPAVISETRDLFFCQYLGKREVPRPEKGWEILKLGGDHRVPWALGPGQSRWPQGHNRVSSAFQPQQSNETDP